MRIHQLYILVILVTIMCTLTGCFTGVESTKRITVKDVEKTVGIKEPNINTDLNVTLPDSFPMWANGKCFYITDHNVRKIFLENSNYELDSLLKVGDVLKYKGYFKEKYLDNEEKVNIRLTDGLNDFIYPTGKTLDEIAKIKNGLTIPFLIDLDMVQAYKKAMSGMEYFIKTPLWYNSEMESIPGRKFVQVRIEDVVPGNSVFPLKLSFVTSEGSRAYLMMSPIRNSLQNRVFDDLFSIKDIRKNYPTVTDKNWDLIVKGEVALEMTKDECRLSLGAPKSIETIPTYGGLQEFWYYGDGTYLRFLDGILRKFRK